MAVRLVNRSSVFAGWGRVSWLLVAALLPFAAASKTPAPASPAPEWATLDARLEQWLRTMLLTLPSKNQFSSVGALAKFCQGSQPDNQPQCAAQVLRHLALIERDIHHRDAAVFVRGLLAWNQRSAAAQIYSQLQKFGDKSVLAQAAVGLAEYDIARHRWQEAVSAAAAGDTAGGQEEMSRLRFLHGVALQEMRKHRPALAQYAKVARTSPHYRHAQLNMAIANIRQDWWTDGHAIITELLKDTPPAADAAFSDRLNTVLGFSLMRQQYYRSARDAFRNVGLDGPYTNKALLGILLSAMYQQDYVGALNAAKSLNRAAVRDLPAEEAPLLLGYIYERLQQPATAMAAYSEAVDYYGKRAAALTAAQLDVGVVRAGLQSGEAAFTLADTRFELEDTLPAAVFANVRLLDRYRPQVAGLNNRALEAEYRALDEAYANLLLKTTQQVVAQRVSYLNHYMSQARFGLAAVHEQAGAAP